MKCRELVLQGQTGTAERARMTIAETANDVDDSRRTVGREIWGDPSCARTPSRAGRSEGVARGKKVERADETVRD